MPDYEKKIESNFALNSITEKRANVEQRLNTAKTNFKNEIERFKNEIERRIYPKIVRVAKKYVGVTQGDATQRKIAKYAGLSYTSAWCAAFVRYCAHEAGVSQDDIPQMNSCSGGNGYGGMKLWFLLRGRLEKSKAHGGKYTPCPGDLVFFNWKGKSLIYDHVGIVEKIHDSTLYTIEGNSGSSTYGVSKVRAQKYPISSKFIAAYGVTGLDNSRDGTFGISGSFAVSEEDVNPDTGRYDDAYSNIEPVEPVEPDGPVKLDITQTRVLSTTGAQGARKFRTLRDAPGVLNQGVELLIQNDKIYMPSVEGDVTLTWERKGTPGTLKFNVLKDTALNFQEGNPVRLRVNGNKMFYGYVFTKSRTDNHLISVTAYDQLRYLKNKDTLAYSGKTYAELLKMIAKDYDLEVGDVADTKYTIPARLEETTLFDMLGNASDLTWQNTQVLYILYDDFGKLALKNPKDMLVPLLIDADTSGGYAYTTTIDSDVYNKVKIATDDDTTGCRNIRVYNGTENQQLWGILQYYSKIDRASDADAKFVAEQMLEYCNTKNRSLKINKAFGDCRVRAGCQVLVKLNLGDLIVSNWMNVEKITHTFSNGEHLMDLTMTYSGVGGEFRA